MQSSPSPMWIHHWGIMETRAKRTLETTAQKPQTAQDSKTRGDTKHSTKGDSGDIIPLFAFTLLCVAAGQNHHGIPLWSGRTPQPSHQPRILVFPLKCAPPGAEPSQQSQGSNICTQHLQTTSVINICIHLHPTSAPNTQHLQPTSAPSICIQHLHPTSAPPHGLGEEPREWQSIRAGPGNSAHPKGSPQSQGFLLTPEHGAACSVCRALPAQVLP